MITSRFESEAKAAVQTLTSTLNRNAIQHFANEIKRNSSRYIRDIVGDHSTHTIDLWRGHLHNLSYEFETHNGVPALQRYSNAQLIRRLNPEAKLIISMRNPVERTYSLYRMHEATSPQDFHNGVLNGIKWWNTCNREGNSLFNCMYIRPKLRDFVPVKCTWLSRSIDAIRKSIYYAFVAEWLSVFPKEQILFLQFEEYIKAEDKTINERIFPFLGLPTLDTQHVNKMRAVTKQIVVSHHKNSAGKPINHKYKSPMLNETKALLQDFFSSYNSRLAILLEDERYLWNS